MDKKTEVMACLGCLIRSKNHLKKSQIPNKNRVHTSNSDNNFNLEKIAVVSSLQFKFTVLRNVFRTLNKSSVLDV